ncbi:MAG TPA: hypothetical protein VFH73_02390 [Polyangia bacterium]|nr:hypothetical protein [Polyangia bacterium]
MRRIFHGKLLACLFATLLGTVGCGSSTSGPTGGPVAGAVDMHCTVNGVKKVQITSMAACAAPSGNDGAAEDGHVHDDGGTTAEDGAGAEAGEEMAEPLHNAEGDDDDCKYHVKFTTTAVRKDDGVTFTVVATKLADGAPAAGAELDAEVLLSPTHPAPNSNTKTTEGPAGTYKIGPIKFDASGEWTVRFHLFEMCSDANQDSPHGHVAFLIAVP